MQLIKYWIGFVLAFWVVSCSQPKKSTSETALVADTIRYAQGFTVQRFADCNVISW